MDSFFANSAQASVSTQNRATGTEFFSITGRLEDITPEEASQFSILSRERDELWKSQMEKLDESLQMILQRLDQASDALNGHDLAILGLKEAVKQDATAANSLAIAEWKEAKRRSARVEEKLRVEVQGIEVALSSGQDEAQVCAIEFKPSDIVEYFSASNNEWIKAEVFQLNNDGTVDLRLQVGFRPHADPRKLRKYASSAHTEELNQSLHTPQGEPLLPEGPARHTEHVEDRPRTADGDNEDDSEESPASGLPREHSSTSDGSINASRGRMTTITASMDFNTVATLTDCDIAV